MTKMATRDAYGKALVKLGQINDNVVVLDADLSKSTKQMIFVRHFQVDFQYGYSRAKLNWCSLWICNSW